MSYPGRFYSTFSRFSADLFSLLFPNLCCGCNEHLHAGEQSICTGCLYRIPYTDHHLDPNNKIARHFWGKTPVEVAVALLYFKKSGRVQRIIHELKYRGRSDAGLVLGKMMGEQLLKTSVHQDIDVILPVPLHKSKEKKRGYNQSLYLAKGLASALDKPVIPSALVRQIATESQVHKGRYSRHENMQNAFAVIRPEELRGRHILLVDDVVTTGATLKACADQLYKAGIRKLSIAAAACPS
jgi:ComF family protein